MNMLGLEGRTVFLTGCNNGIGQAIYSSLLDVHAFPIGIEIGTFEDSELAQDIKRRDLHWQYELGIVNIIRKGKSDHSHYPKLPEDILVGAVMTPEANMKYILPRYSVCPVGGLVLNAGLGGRDTKYGGSSDEVYSRFFEENMQNQRRWIETLQPYMRRGSSIVTMGSIETEMSNGDDVMYVSTKSGLLGLTKAYAAKLGPRGIRVNMVSPGNVMTDGKKARLEQNPEANKLVDAFTLRTPMREAATPQEIANIVLFLLSDLSSAITGANIPADKGYLIGGLWDENWGTDAIEAYKRF